MKARLDGDRYEEAEVGRLSESLRILDAAKYAALDEIVARGIRTGIAIAEGRTNERPSIFDAVNAYYIARRASEVAFAECLDAVRA